MNAVESGIARSGKLSYMQLPATDAPALAEFYRASFGWAIRGGGGAHVSFADASGELIGAFVTARAPVAAIEEGPLPYIYVANVSAALQTLIANGASEARAPYKEGPLTVATFRDPQGNHIGIWSGA